MPIELIDVSKSYSGRVLLSGLSYRFPERGLFLLCGKSGAGKTTLLRIIAGLEQPDTGKVVRSGAVSFLFQDRRLFPALSAIENVRIVARRPIKKEQATAEAAALLTALGIASEDFEKRSEELSGGMQQRVAIARALYFDAPVLLLDEPSKELDPANRARLRPLFLREADKRLVILVSHEKEDFDYPAAVQISL